MQRTLLAQRTDTAQAARYVSSRVLGDLLSIHEKFSIATEARMRALGHDVEVALVHDCISALRLFLYPPLWASPLRAYEYQRTAPGTFKDSSHSGRIERSAALVGGSISFEVIVLDAGIWDNLCRTGAFRLNWVATGGTAIHGLRARSDGGYSSGDLGLARTMYYREGY